MTTEGPPEENQIDQATIDRLIEKPFFFPDRIKQLPNDKRVAALQNKQIRQMIVDRLLRKGEQNSPNLGILEARIEGLSEGVPEEIMSEILHNPEIIDFIVDYVTKTPGKSPNQERIDHLPSAIKEDVINDPRFKERFPDYSK